MSRGCVKEDDQEEIPLVPPRADLPEGIIIYVTQIGMDELLMEKEQLYLSATNSKLPMKVKSALPPTISMQNCSY